jgi:hypothetical protein
VLSDRDTNTHNDWLRLLYDWFRRDLCICILYDHSDITFAKGGRHARVRILIFAGASSFCLRLFMLGLIYMLSLQLD